MKFSAILKDSVRFVQTPGAGMLRVFKVGRSSEETLGFEPLDLDVPFGSGMS